MAGTLDYVRKGEAITAEKWNALVERINALEQRPSFGFGVSKKTSGGDVIRACLITSYPPWSQEGNRWKATARFYDTWNRTVIQNPTFDLYCPAGNSKLNESGQYSNNIVWAKYNKANQCWEALREPLGPKEIRCGAYLEGPYYDVSLDGYRIDNAGTTNVKIPGDAYSNTKTLYFHNRFFKWIPSTLDVVGKKEISLIVHTETVVTPNGNKQIYALGPES